MITLRFDGFVWDYGLWIWIGVIGDGVLDGLSIVLFLLQF